MKKAVVLGVGNAQVDLIRYLKLAGWWVIGCSYRHEGRGLKDIDQFALINITDINGIEQLALSEKADLVCSIGSDLAMPTVAAVAAKLSLPASVSPNIADLLQNKLKLRAFLKVHDISPIEYKKVCGPDDMDDWGIFPAIIKPVDNQGQRGVFLVNCLNEARAVLKDSLCFSRSECLIIEEYLEGPEISANTFVVNGKTIFNEISDRLVLEGYAGGIPQGHIYPTVSCSKELLEKVKKLIETCNRELGIENGPVYYQVILNIDGPKIVEVTPRLDGCHMWRLIKMVSGVDLLEASVQNLLGDGQHDFKLSPCLENRYLGFYYSPPNGEFHLDDHKLSKSVDYQEYYYHDGERVRPVNGFLEKVGYYIRPHLN